MRSHLFAVLAIGALALYSIGYAMAAPNYTLSISPASGIVNLGNTPTLTFTVMNGQPNQVYSVNVDVQKPNGTGIATAVSSFPTDTRGLGSVSFVYPSASFTPASGTVGTNVLGVYNVDANLTAPSTLGIVATLQFVVNSQLIVVISRPTGGTIARGAAVVVTATVSDLNSRPVSRAIVSSNTPTGNAIGLIEKAMGSGVYEAEYDSLLGDPIGAWTIQVVASDSSGNSGMSNQVSLTLTANTLIVEAFTAYNSRGLPSADFNFGDTIYPFFRVRYSTSGQLTQYVTQGQFRVGVKNPSGVLVANLSATYDYTRSGFSTPTGHSISDQDPTGSWSIVIELGSIIDQYQNSGPAFQASIRVEIRTGTIVSPTAYFQYLVGGVIALLSIVFLYRRLSVSRVGPRYLDTLMGGPIPRSSSLLILGDPGSGKTVLAYRLLHDELEAGRQCALLSYDAFPESVKARMSEFGWDITPNLESGQLRIIDCYSGLAGDADAQVKEPTDLTEVTILVASAITKAGGQPVTLVLDSLTPIFNGLEARQPILFIQTLGAKVKKAGGVFMLTASVGAVPTDSIAKIKSIVDGVVELNLLRKGRRLNRYLSVVKMERRRVSPEAVPFEVDAGTGLVFRVYRFKLWRNLVPRNLVSELHRKLANVWTRLKRPGHGAQPYPALESNDASVSSSDGDTLDGTSPS